MYTIKVKCFNQYTNENVCKHFEWHEERGRLCEVAKDSVYAAGISATLFNAGCDAVKLCEKHGLTVKSLEYRED